MKIKTRGKIILGVSLMIAAAIFLTGLYLYNKPHSSVADVKASIQITADKLYNDYALNENNANQKYLNKVIEVTGSVADTQSVNGSKIILLSSSASLGGISCELANNESKQNFDLKKSSTITVKGKCSGYLMDVNLVDCVVKN